MRYGIVLDEVFARHAPPGGHPERPERIRSIVQAVNGWEQNARLLRVPAARADEKWIRAVHARAHFEAIKRTAGKPFTQLDPDTYTSQESFEIAMLAAGSVVRLVDELLSGRIDTGFALIRPPGHHAESNRVMGFCLFNNVAVAAEFALQERGLRKVAILDFDVHHGNGTQEIFYARPDVLYISQHQYPFYPGTGHFHEVGKDAGAGFTVNFPIRAGMGNHFYCSLFRDFVVPILRQYEPDLLLISAGYDAHRSDPLAGMELDEDGYGALASVLNRVAEEVCGGHILYVLEGGYHLTALPQSVLRTIGATLDRGQFEIQEEQAGEYSAYRDTVRPYLSQFWKL